MMNILAYDKGENKTKANFQSSYEVICPMCGDDILLDIKNNKFFFSGCKKNHTINSISINEFIKTQNIDTNKIICEICKKKTLGESFEQKFYYCVFCKSNLCVLCNSTHNQSHKIVKYEQKNDYCEKHFSNYLKYCNQCKRNMCIQCEREHKNHNTLYFGDILIDKDKYLEEISSFKIINEQLQKQINSIINLLINVSENINSYYKIANDMIKNYTLDNLNYFTLKNLATFSNYNKMLLKDLTSIINEEDIIIKFESLIKIFHNNNEKKKNSSFIEKLLNYSDLKFNSEVTTLIPLNNNKDIAICFLNGFLCIYNSETLEQKLIMNPTKFTILDIIALKDNKVCIACWDKIIRIIQFNHNNTEYEIIQELKGHNDLINCLKQSFFWKDEIMIFSSSNDGRILLWKYNNMNHLFELFNKIKINVFENLSENSQLQIEALEESIQHQILICGISSKRNIYFCDLNNFSNIEKINVSVNRCIRALKIINKDILIVAGNKEISIVNLKNKLILHSIHYYSNCEFNCIFQRKNGNILISEFGDINKIKEYQFNEKTSSLNLISIREKDFKSYVTTISETLDGYLICGGYDCKIKFFKKNND